jgi:tetratricopeptide (TPR) repeat protein
VGAALKVRAVVTGQVQHQGERLVISVELVDTETARALWGDQYPRPFADLLIVQDTIAREIAEALRLHLSGEAQRQMAKRYTQNAEAHQLFLQGRYHWNKRTTDGMNKSLDYFQQAITKDPNYALAYVGIADAYATLLSYHLKPAKEAGPAARTAAEKALAIDPDLAEAHASLGKLYTEYFWDGERGEREFQRAIALNPNYGNAHHWYSLYWFRTWAALMKACAKLSVPWNWINIRRSSAHN